MVQRRRGGRTRASWGRFNRTLALRIAVVVYTAAPFAAHSKVVREASQVEQHHHPHTSEVASYAYVPLYVDNTSQTCNGAYTSWGDFGQEVGAQSLELCQLSCNEHEECWFIQYQPSRNMCHLYKDCSSLRSCPATCERTLEKKQDADEAEDKGEDEEKKEGGEGEEEEEEHEEEEDEEGEEEAEREEAEEEFTPIDVTISCCICGGIAFVMMLFYIVNYPDEDIKYYAWSVISSTISIFTAVLVFQGLNAVIEVNVLSRLSHIGRAIANYSLLGIWFMLLQVAIMFISGARKLPEAFAPQNRAEENCMMKCWVKLLAHMSAFSAIYSGGSMLHVHEFPHTVWRASLLVLVHCIILCGYLTLFENMRYFVATKNNEHEDLWFEEANEAENEVMGLSVSFIGVQVIRFIISGIMPNHEGAELPQHAHPLSFTLLLLGIGGGFAILVVVLVLVISKLGLSEHSKKRRTLIVCQVISAMAFAWSSFFGWKWELKRLIPDWDPNCMMARVLLALVVSASSILLIFFLDYVEDLDSTGKEADRAIVSIIESLGVLVGFSWEQSFEGAVSVFASLTSFRASVKLGLACCIALVVIPAWKMYILPLLIRSELRYRNQDAKKRTKKLQLSDMRQFTREEGPPETRSDRRKLELTQSESYVRLPPHSARDTDSEMASSR